MIRRLIASLLLLPLVLGAPATAMTAGARADVSGTAAGVLAAAHGPAALLAASTTVLDARVVSDGTGGSSRAPTQFESGAVGIEHEAAARASRGVAARSRYLIYSLDLARARTNTPTTFGNPPPHPRS